MDGNDLWGDWALFARSVVASCVESGVGSRKRPVLCQVVFEHPARWDLPNPPQFLRNRYSWTQSDAK